MENFIIAAGHTTSGNIGCGVVDRLDESRCTREIVHLFLPKNILLKSYML